MNITLYTGKGGVGKTTVAAARALQLAEQGKRVIIMSTDQAHSLGDSLCTKLSNEPTRVAGSLYALEIDTIIETEKAWGKIKNYLLLLLSANGGQTIETEELLAFPGFDELFALLRIRDFADSGEYDEIIVDCAPTGETLSLLKFPDMLGNIITSVLPMKRNLVNVVGPTVEKVTKIPMPKNDVFDEMLDINEKLEGLSEILHQDTTHIRIVTTPERVVTLEAKKNFGYLRENGFNTDEVIVNRIYPEGAMEGYFSKWITMQEKSLEDIDDFFGKAGNCTITHKFLQPHEVYGIDALLKF